MGCTKDIAIKYKNIKVLFEIDLLELTLKKLKEILVPTNPPDFSKNSMGNINLEESKNDAENGLSVTECCLGKTEKLAIPAKVALLQSAIIWMSDLGASVHCSNE